LACTTFAKLRLSVEKKGSCNIREETIFAAANNPSASAWVGVETGEVFAEMKTSVVCWPCFQVRYMPTPAFEDCPFALFFEAASTKKFGPEYDSSIGVIGVFAGSVGVLCICKLLSKAFALMIT
jgi:hypothetical protein